MPNNVLHKASDLPPDLRQAVGRLLGRALEPEEHVSVTAYRPHKAPTGQAQVELAARLKERIDKAAERLKDIPEAEVDDLIDEEVDHVRHRRPVRVVLDTGVLVRANAKSKGPAREVLMAIIDGAHELVTSAFLLDETARVVRYPRLLARHGLSDLEIEEHVDYLRQISELVDVVVRKPVVLSDPDDDPVVYTAVDGRADVCFVRAIGICWSRPSLPSAGRTILP